MQAKDNIDLGGVVAALSGGAVAFYVVAGFLYEIGFSWGIDVNLVSNLGIADLFTSFGASALPLTISAALVFLVTIYVTWIFGAGKRVPFSRHLMLMEIGNRPRTTMSILVCIIAITIASKIMTPFEPNNNFTAFWGVYSLYFLIVCVLMMAMFVYLARSRECKGISTWVYVGVQLFAISCASGMNGFYAGRMALCSAASLSDSKSEWLRPRATRWNPEQTTKYEHHWNLIRAYSNITVTMSGNLGTQWIRLKDVRSGDDAIYKVSSDRHRCYTPNKEKT